jgi:DNA (cytosine-5)-methyltransferase 1
LSLPNELALFAGAGGGLLASRLLGWHTVCAVEIDEYCRRTILARQRDNLLDRFPIWDDIRTFDGRPWRGKIDIISGGFPCQDVSAAGKGAGLAGERSGLWFEMRRVIEEVRPRFVFTENSPNLRTRGLGAIIENLTSLGYDCRWCVLGAGHVGAPHRRNRMWIVAHSKRNELRDQQRGRRRQNGQDKVEFRDNGTAKHVAHTAKQYRSKQRQKASEFRRGCEIVAYANSKSKIWSPESWKKCGPWSTEPTVGRVVNGLAHRVDRLRALGNGQVPGVAVLAWLLLTSDLKGV